MMMLFLLLFVSVVINTNIDSSFSFSKKNYDKVQDKNASLHFPQLKWMYSKKWEETIIYFEDLFNVAICITIIKKENFDFESKGVFKIIFKKYWYEPYFYPILLFKKLVK